MTTPFLSSHRSFYLHPAGHVLAALESTTAEEHSLYIMKYLNVTEADFVLNDRYPLQKLEKLFVSQKMIMDSINYFVQLFCFQCLKTWHLS